MWDERVWTKALEVEVDRCGWIPKIWVNKLEILLKIRLESKGGTKETLGFFLGCSTGSLLGAGVGGVVTQHPLPLPLILPLSFYIYIFLNGLSTWLCVDLIRLSIKKGTLWTLAKAWSIRLSSETIKLEESDAWMWKNMWSWLTPLIALAIWSLEFLCFCDIPIDSVSPISFILLYLFIFPLFIECIGGTLANKMTQVSSGQFYNTSSAHCAVCSPPPWSLHQELFILQPCIGCALCQCSPVTWTLNSIMRFIIAFKLFLLWVKTCFFLFFFLPGKGK